MEEGSEVNTAGLEEGRKGPKPRNCSLSSPQKGRKRTPLQSLQQGIKSCCQFDHSLERPVSYF